MVGSPLTDAFIRGLETRSGQYEVFDTKIAGLTIRIGPSGKKSFCFVYRFGRQNRRLTLGRYPNLGVADARQLAKDASIQVAKGIDPQTLKTRVRETYSDQLLSSVVLDFVETHAKQNMRTWRETERILRKQIVPELGKFQIDQITRQQVHLLMVKLLNENGCSAANHGFSQIRRLFNWCVETGQIDKSPCLGMKPPAKTTSRDRVLNESELVSIWIAATKMGPPFGAIVRLLIATGQRRTEVAGLRWNDLNLDHQIWNQPSHSNKSGRSHIVPLNRLALDTLQYLPREHSDHVFLARQRDRQVSGFSKWKKKIDRISSVENWTLHDIRRTVATGMASLNVPLHIVELILNHRSSQLGGVAGIYNRHSYLDEQREALEHWAHHVERLVGQNDTEPA